jgi:hypothetical protein
VNILFNYILLQSKYEGWGKREGKKGGGKAKTISIISVILFYRVLVMAYDT